ncbi:sigma-70 family RNA polymerase sigma factor [Zhouia sp. PK063]|uniref:sigma-70 family RNA polymerase sigma factor n=1 Tax=Zhouia sp. PK063 TaxID=3373602 RepID=UPI0037A65E36
MPEHQLFPDKWVDLYADYLFNYAITRVSDSVIAEDLVQETFFAGLKSAKNFKGEASERTWLVSILKRKIIDHYRKINSKKGQAEVRINYNSDSEEDGDWLEERVADPFDGNAEFEMENEELGEAILSCLEKLPPKQAQVFKMKTIQGIDTEDICKELDITPSNLWVIIHRARTALSSCLEQNWFN